MKQYSALMKEALIYGVIGLISSGTDAVLFRIFVYQFRMFSLVANVLSTGIGILISYVLNLNFNFKVKDHLLKRFLSFSAIGIFGLLITSFLLILGERQNWNIFLTKLFAIVFVAVVQFLLNKCISFKKTSSPNKL